MALASSPCPGCGHSVSPVYICKRCFDQTPPSPAVVCLQNFIEAFDSGHIEMNSPEIDYGDREPPAPWHIEWLTYARAAIVSGDKP